MAWSIASRVAAVRARRNKAKKPVGAFDEHNRKVVELNKQRVKKFGNILKKRSQVGWHGLDRHEQEFISDAGIARMHQASRAKKKESSEGSKIPDVVGRVRKPTKREINEHIKRGSGKPIHHPAQ